MRVLLDTNVFVSYLLSPDRGGTITTVVDAALSGRYSLLVPQEQFDKLFEVLTTKPYIASRVSQHGAVQFVDSLRAIAVLPPIIDEAIPKMTTCSPTRWSDEPTTWWRGTMTCCRSARLRISRSFHRRDWWNC